VIWRWWPATVVAVACVAVLQLSRPDVSAVAPPREVQIMARQYAYEPHRIVVDPGDEVHLRLASTDVVHGFFLEGYDVEAEIRPGSLTAWARRPSTGEDFREVEEIVFSAGSPGKYRYRCSVTCGTLHPFMQGEMIVRPNTLYRASLIAACGLALGIFGLMMTGALGNGASRVTEGIPGRRIDLLRKFPGLRRLATRRWFQFAVVLPNLLVLFFFVVAGFFGSPIGNRNIIVTVVWILWWFLLITVLVPAGGRVWCMACPIPFAGEWLARRRLIGVRREAERSRSLRTGGLNRRWPHRLSRMWVQNLLFLTVCTVSTILVTRPALTAAVLLTMVLVAVVVHALYKRRSFCRYLCPLNAWLSVYSMAAATEVRPRDSDRCADCREHACAGGSTHAWGCPWMVNPSRLDRNNYCGLCMECVKACPNGNMTIHARPLFADTSIRRLDEAFMALIMIALVIAYTVTLLGPWGTPREWSNVTEVGNWGGFALHASVVWLFALGVLPAIWYGLSKLAHRFAGSQTVSTREIFVRYAYLLVPVGLLAWIAFSLPLIMLNWTHIVSSLSDPLGWGWDLFGTARQHWSPLYPEWIPSLQVPLLLLGLTVALVRGHRVASDLFPDRSAAIRSLIPHGVMCAAITVVMLRLFVG
jgi:polyferredoxin/plastocyanin